MGEEKGYDIEKKNKVIKVLHGKIRKHNKAKLTINNNNNNIKSMLTITQLCYMTFLVTNLIPVVTD